MPSKHGVIIHIWHVEEFVLDTSQKKCLKLCDMGKMRRDAKFAIYLYVGTVCFVLVVVID